MISTTSKEKDEVVIQDIMITASITGEVIPKGEFGSYELSEEKPQELSNRLYQQVEDLISKGSNIHKQSNFTTTGDMKPEKLNHITRIVTNEFFFYTWKPLELEQFEALMQKIIDLAKVQPQNLHFMLGSFAVKTPDGLVMNVVPCIECGKEPKINLVVKSHFSAFDPVYSEEVIADAGLERRPLKCANVKEGHVAEHHSIKIDNKSVCFSFKNVFLCKTAGNVSFFSCCDICADHYEQVAKSHLDGELKNALDHAHDGLIREPLPFLSSYTVVSNSIELNQQISLGMLSQCDPLFKQMLTGATIHSQNKFADITFGSTYDFCIIEPKKCTILPADEIKLINQHNLQIAMLHFQKGLELYENKSLQNANDHFLKFTEIYNNLDKPSREKGDALLQAVIEKTRMKDSHPISMVHQLINNIKETTETKKKNELTRSIEESEESRFKPIG